MTLARTRPALPVLIALPVLTALGGSPRSPADDAEARSGDRPAVLSLDEGVRALLDEQGDGVVASIWVGGPRGDAWYTLEPDAARPSASAIKTAYLVALFARFADALDAAPPGLDEALSDDHPAMAPYPPAQRQEIREALRGASVREIGGVMMGSIPAPNHVYNAAASAATALLGGPEALTRAIRDLDPAFGGIVARRYMLAPRDATGDNEATAASLAAVLGRLAIGEVPGLEAGTVAAIRGAVMAGDGEYGLDGRHRSKGGSLNSDPITRVRSGWWEAPGIGPIVYAVMLARPDPGPLDRAEAADRLDQAAAAISAMALRAARDDRAGR